MGNSNQTLEIVTSQWPAWAVMWLLAIAIFAVCKCVTWWWRQAACAPAWLQVGYLFAWPGLDADAFLDSSQQPRVVRPTLGEWLLAGIKTAIGLVLVFVSARMVSPSQPYIAGWVGMIGIVLVLHFGLFHALSCAWRSIGVNAKPLMNWPLRATSASEFWGQRWNTAFRDLTYKFFFRPRKARLGPHGAVLAGFGFSGLVHDAVISLPAGGGYGGPTLFFVIQSLGLLAERSRIGKELGLGRGMRGWLFTMTLLAAPAGLLFHQPFVLRVVNPFLVAIGALT